MARNNQVESVAARLKKAMDEKGMKQVDLVNATGLDKGAISHYLSGKYEPKQIAINKLAVALDVSEMWLWGYDVEQTRTAAQKKNDDLAEIIALMRKDADFYDVVLSMKNIKNTSEKQYEVIKQLLSTFGE